MILTSITDLTMQAAIEADRKRRGEPVAFAKDGALFWHGEHKHGVSCDLYVAPQPAEHNIDYEKLYEQMCNRCDSLDAKLAEYERRGEPVAWRTPKAGIGNGYNYVEDMVGEEERFLKYWQPLYAAPVAAQPSVPLSMGLRSVAAELLACFRAWEPGVRVLGNVQAKDGADLMQAILATLPADGPPPKEPL